MNKPIDSFYQATKFIHNGSNVFIRRDGELFERHYVTSSGLAGKAEYNEVTVGYWPELAEQMWAGLPGSDAQVCASCGKPL